MKMLQTKHQDSRFVARLNASCNRRARQRTKPSRAMPLQTIWLVPPIGSINGRLPTFRTYAKISAKAGAITPAESILIASVQGYANKEAKHVDEKRRADGMRTRRGTKKAEAVTIPEDIAQALRDYPPMTPAAIGRPTKPKTKPP